MMRATFTNDNGDTAVVYGCPEGFWVRFEDDDEPEILFSSWGSAVQKVNSLGFS